jgi:hypothetical protein
VKTNGEMMTVQELIEQLLRYDLDMEVVIPASKTFLTMGPRPSTPVTGAYKGTDWDRGYVFIYPESKLVQLNEYQFGEFSKEVRQHDWIRSDISKGVKPRGIIPPMFNPRPPEDESNG